MAPPCLAAPFCDINCRGFNRLITDFWLQIPASGSKQPVFTLFSTVSGKNHTGMGSVMPLIPNIPCANFIIPSLSLPLQPKF